MKPQAGAGEFSDQTIMLTVTGHKSINLFLYVQGHCVSFLSFAPFS